MDDAAENTPAVGTVGDAVEVKDAVVNLGFGSGDGVKCGGFEEKQL